MFCMLVADLRLVVGAALLYERGVFFFSFFFGKERDSVAIQRFKGCIMFFLF